MAKKHTPKTDDVTTTISAGVTTRMKHHFYSLCETLELVPGHVLRDLVYGWVEDNEKRIKNALNGNEEPVTEEKPASEKQKSFIRYLTHQLHLPQQDLSNVTMTEACKLIEDLKRADITQKPDGEKMSLF